VAQDRVRAAGLDRREEPAFERDVAVAHGVNPAVKGVELAAPGAHHDGIKGEPAVTQVLRGEHAPLLGGEASDPHIRASVDLIRLRRIKRALGRHWPIVAPIV
jgi:hypothetical protein